MGEEIDLFSDMEQPDLFPELGAEKIMNPMIRVYGTGPQGTKCANCKHITMIRPGQNTYHKCKLRSITHGAGTDHRLKWQSCGKYEILTAP